MPTRALSLATVIGSDGALNLADVAGLHTVAGTGSYTDLINKPTIPSSALTFTGDASGSGTTGTSTSLTLANSGVSAGSYGSASAIPQITVDAKGRITAISTNAVSIPSSNISVTGGDLTLSGSTGTGITNATLASVGTAGTYTKVTTDAKGRVTSGTTLASSDLPTYTGTITSSQVTTALGYTPYRAVTVEGAATAPTNGLDAALQGWTAFDGYGAVVPNYPNNQWWVGAWTGGNSVRGVQLAGGYADSELYFRKGQDGWQSWKRIWHAGNLTNLNQLSNGPGYITGESDTLATVTGRGSSTPTAITINNTITSSSTIQATNGRIALRDDSIENWATASDSAGIAVNYYGYSSGTSYYRDFIVYDGKGGLRFKTYGSGNYSYASGSMRAPIFYDSDTSYYVDPNSTSNLAGLTVSNTITGSISGNADTVDNRHASYFYPAVTDQGYSTGDINGSTTHQRLWGFDSVQDLLQFRPPTSVEYSTNGSTWTSTSISSEVFNGKIFGKWGGFSLNVGNNVGAWRYVRLTWQNFGYHFWSHITLAHSTNGHSFNLVFYRSSLDGNTWTETFRQNNISSWPGYTFSKYQDVSGWWDTRDVRIVFELNHVNDYPNNAIGVGHIGLMGSYNGFTRLYDWDGSRNVVFGGNVYAPIFYDNNNSAYYADLSSTGDSIRAAGNIIAYYSDDRLKTKLGNITDALKKVNQLNGFYYQANELAQNLGYKPTLEVGVSAQEVEQILPQIVKPAPIDQQYKTVDYSRLVPLLIEAVKELSQKLSKLEAKYGITS